MITADRPSQPEWASLMEAALAAALATALAFALLVPAHAAPEFYVVRDTATKNCTLVNSPPNTTALELIDGGRVYFDKADAQRALSAINGCRPREDSEGISARRRSRR